MVRCITAAQNPHVTSIGQRASSLILVKTVKMTGTHVQFSNLKGKVKHFYGFE